MGVSETLGVIGVEIVAWFVYGACVQSRETCLGGLYGDGSRGIARISDLCGVFGDDNMSSFRRYDARTRTARWCAPPPATMLQK